MGENIEVKPRRRTVYSDRVILKPELLAKSDGWIEQVKAKRKGVRISRKDVVLWKLKQASADLSDVELEELTSAFYDEERFLLDLLKEVKAAKARGEKATLPDLDVKPSKASARRKRRSKVNDSGASEGALPVILSTDSEQATPSE